MTPNIKLKQEHSDTKVDFLDVTVFKGNLVKSENRLSTKLFRKPTDTMELLHKNSHTTPNTHLRVLLNHKYFDFTAYALKKRTLKQHVNNYSQPSNQEDTPSHSSGK